MNILPPNLENLNISNNLVSKLEFLKGGLTNLDVSHNFIKSLKGIQKLQKLKVLNLKDNELKSV